MSTEGCNVSIRVKAGADGGLPIKGITVEAKGKSGKYFELKCGKGWPASSTCVFNKGIFASRRLFSFVILSPPLENITDEGITSTRCKLVKSSSPLFVISRVTFNVS